MRSWFLLLSLIILLPVWLGAQQLLDGFENGLDTTAYNIYADVQGTYLIPELSTDIVHDGQGAVRIKWQDRCYDQWGGWIGMTHLHPDTGVYYDFSLYTDLTLWYYNEVKQSKAGQVEFRIILREGGPNTNENYDDPSQFELWFSHHYILDDDPGWHKIDIKLEDVGMMSSEGFWAPGWGQSVDGDGILQLDKIKGWTFEFSQGNALYQQPDDSVSGVFIMDQFQLEGIAPVNLVFFNGKSVPPSVNMHVGWSGTVEITDEEAYTPGTNSIKWTCGSGWDGVNFDLNKPRNLVFNWSTDSVQFKIKTDAGLGDLMLVFSDTDEDGDAKDDYPFQATYLLKESDMNYDGTWKMVKVALRDFNRFAGVWDNDLQQMVPGEFDSTKVARFAIVGNGQDFTGHIVYLDDIWTGNPVFDWTPPAQVTGVGAAPGDYYNLVYWTDVDGEQGETYNVYASTKPITDINDPTLEIVAQNVAEGTSNVVHYIYYPLKDHNVTYYYAVECVDASGNVGPAGFSDAVTNVGKGVPTIWDHAPANFAADGDFTDWEGFMPWVITPEDNNVAAGDVTDSNDLTATVYLAFDDDYLYVGADVLDDVFSYDPALVSSWWTQDAFEMFIGLWDQNGKAIHDENPWLNRGAEPDYKLIFLPDRYTNEYRNSALGRDPFAPDMTPADADYHFEDFGESDYVLEARIPLDSIRFGDDVRFHPMRGMRLMFDLVFHDNDGSGWEGNLTWSPNNKDLAYLDQHEWTFTWIGDTTSVATAIDDDLNGSVVYNYNLKPNYPNPFNPVTTIEYSLAKPGMVTLEIYDLLGKRVKTLVQERQQAGTHQVVFDASDLSSGIYFYKIKANQFVRTRKMLLVK